MVVLKRYASDKALLLRARDALAGPLVHVERNLIAWRPLQDRELCVDYFTPEAKAPPVVHEQADGDDGEGDAGHQ